MRVKIETSEGVMVLELWDDKVPDTVKNFISYVKSGHYEGTTIHRVVKDFMFQGGGYDIAYKKKKTNGPILNEAYLSSDNRKYTIGMARNNMPHTANCQWYINTADNTTILNHTNKTNAGWGYVTFGEVVEGKEIVDKINDVPVYRYSEEIPNSPHSALTITSIDLIDD